MSHGVARPGEGLINSVASCTTRDDDTSIYTRDKVVILQVLLELPPLIAGIFSVPCKIYSHFSLLCLDFRHLLRTLDDGHTAKRHRPEPKPRP
jgi:hypothetical protein